MADHTPGVTLVVMRYGVAVDHDHDDLDSALHDAWHQIEQGQAAPWKILDRDRQILLEGDALDHAIEAIGEEIEAASDTVSDDP